MTEAPSKALTAAILGIVAIAIGTAIVAGSNLALAVPAAVAAVALTMFLGLLSVAGSGDRDPGQRPSEESRPTLRIEWALAGDRIHREEVVMLLDQIERGGPNPALPSRPRTEVAKIVAMDPPSFRQYVAGRIDLLEREA